MPISIGDRAPDFSLVDVDGIPHTLSQYRGRKIMLSFYHATDQLKGKHKKLAWAAELEVIAVFQSPTEIINKFILNARDMENDSLPSTHLSDPDLETYAKYGVCNSGFGSTKGIKSYLRRSKACKDYGGEYYQENTIQVERSWSCLPSDFLIDENGIIVDCYRAKEINEHIPLERITSFLLGKNNPISRKESDHFDTSKRPTRRRNSFIGITPNSTTFGARRNSMASIIRNPISVTGNDSTNADD